MARLTIQFIDKQTTTYEVEGDAPHIFHLLQNDKQFLSLVRKGSRADLAINKENIIQVDFWNDDEVGEKED